MEDDTDTKRISKKPRVYKGKPKEDIDDPAAPSFSDLTNDLLVRCLDFLTWGDMNEFACVSKQCRQVRAHTSLDQTRQGTVRILFGSGLSSLGFLDHFLPRLGRIFVGNRTHLRLVGLDHLNRVDFYTFEDSLTSRQYLPLGGVKSVIFSQDREYMTRVGEVLARFLPNLESVDVGSLTILSDANFFGEYAACPHLRCLRYTDCGKSNEHSCGLDICGYYIRNLSSLRELYIDDSALPIADVADVPDLFDDFHVRNGYILLKTVRRQLERVSFIGIEYSNICYGRRLGEPESISQEQLIEFVHNAPNLKWMRSDLTESNKLMLKRERPDVHFE